MQCNLANGGRPSRAKVDGDVKKYTFANLRPGGRYVIKIIGQSCGTIDQTVGYNCIESRPSKSKFCSQLYLFPIQIIRMVHTTNGDASG